MTWLWKYIWKYRLYNAIPTAEELQKKTTTYVGTIMTNKKGVPTSTKLNLQKVVKFYLQNLGENKTVQSWQSLTLQRQIKIFY